jgi:hypothetical protein
VQLSQRVAETTESKTGFETLTSRVDKSSNLGLITKNSALQGLFTLKILLTSPISEKISGLFNLIK